MADQAAIDWKRMFQEQLPAAAKTRSGWPVTLDHCFARIILDSVVGDGKQPWHEVIKKPAYKNMTMDQLQRATSLGQAVLDGDEDLNKLNAQSLDCRGKTGKLRKTTTIQEDSPPESEVKSQKRKLEQPTLSFGASKKARTGTVDEATLDRLYSLVDSSEKSPFQKAVLKLLCQVPPGRWSTYGAMAKHLDSHARSVGQALRNNHLAPDVPCHRVLAANGELGGFGGSWGANGAHAAEKIKLLKDEGLKFDSKGRATGQPFSDFR